ncbi:MAG: DUF4396 domain-containing protein [Candidatus Pacebacteria bacterium]|nr:DUF4396 domain-containing protein [Candidatus Paceibacterota bacterium]
MRLDQLTKLAIRHTLHCLFGCSIGEMLGMSITTLLGWAVFAKVIFSIPLAFFFGYLLTSWSLKKSGISWRHAIKTALSIDTVSILSMEAVDSTFLLFIPGATNAHLGDSLYWFKLLASLVVAFVITIPVNRYFISRKSDHKH